MHRSKRAGFAVGTRVASRPPCNRCVRFVATVASGHATLATKRALRYPVIGFLSGRTQTADAHLVITFHNGLKETGYIEGQNIATEYRWAEGHYDRLPELAAELVRRHVAVIIAGGLPTALAAKVATTTIPVVFVLGVDPVKFGLGAAIETLAPLQLRLATRQTTCLTTK